MRGDDPSVTASPCQLPLRRGAFGDADCHSQCAHWLRNDIDNKCGGVPLQKASQSLPPAGGKKLRSFFTATCAWGKIPLRLPVWNLSVMDGQIMRAADCKPFVGKTRRVFRQYQKKAVPKDSLFEVGGNYSSMAITTPEPTVRPPSRIAKRRPFSMAMGVISSTFMSTLSPGMHISVPSGRVMTPVTSVVRK